jgi:hypothetical protein
VSTGMILQYKFAPIFVMVGIFDIEMFLAGDLAFASEFLYLWFFLIEGVNYSQHTRASTTSFAPGS